MGNLKKGDRIRLTLEADVLYGSSFGVDLAVPAVAGGQFTIREREFSDVEFEKIEPPVETFGPGTYVHSKAVPRYRYLILEDGYVDLTNNKYEPYNPPFTSDYYVKINPGD